MKRGKPAMKSVEKLISLVLSLQELPISNMMRDKIYNTYHDLLRALQATKSLPESHEGRDNMNYLKTAITCHSVILSLVNLSYHEIGVGGGGLYLEEVNQQLEKIIDNWKAHNGVSEELGVLHAYGQEVFH